MVSFCRFAVGSDTACFYSYVRLDMTCAQDRLRLGEQESDLLGEVRKYIQKPDPSGAPWGPRRTMMTFGRWQGVEVDNGVHL